MPDKENRQTNNQILAALPSEDYQRLLPHFKPVSLPSGEILYNIGDRIDYIYFPFAAVVSLVLNMENGLSVEVGIVGSDGAVGVTALMGVDKALSNAIVQIPNGAMQVRMSVIKEEFNRGKELQKLLLNYTAAFIKQVSQTAACNNHHSIEERLARWLLMCHDRISLDELQLTQEFIANMLGSRRPTVSMAAAALQTEGLIHYKHGHIKIIDRQGLEAFSCECYEALKER